MDSPEYLYRLWCLNSKRFLSLSGITYFTNKSSLLYLMKLFNISEENTKIIKYKLTEVNDETKGDNNV